MRNFPINCGFLVVGEYLQMNLKIDIFTSDPISSQQAANISNKEGMDVSTTESVQEEIAPTNSSTNPSSGVPNLQMALFPRWFSRTWILIIWAQLLKQHNCPWIRKWLNICRIRQRWRKWMLSMGYWMLSVFPLFLSIS